MVSSWNGCWIAPSSSSKSSIHAPKTSDYAPQPRKEKSHLPNTYYCAADDLAAVIPPPASSWHQASPYSLHQQAIPHKRKATDLADSTREKGIHSNCSYSYVDTKRKKSLEPFFLSIPFHNHKGLLNQQERSKLTYPWRTAEENFSLLSLPLKSKMLLFLHREQEVSIILRTSAKEGVGSLLFERIDLEPVLLIILFPFLTLIVEGLALS